MEASDIKRLKKLEHENDRLKRMYVNLSLENAALKEVIAKKTLRPAERREVVTYLVMVRGLQVQQTCRAVGLGRATYYRPLMDWARSDASGMIALTTLVVAKGRCGFWQCCDRLQLDGHPWNPKRL